MTKISFTKSQGFIKAFEVSGHSGFSKSGTDIVCAAISTATQMALYGLKYVLNLDIDEIVDEKNAVIKVDLGLYYKTQTVCTLVNTLELCLQDISRQYPQFVQVYTKSI